MGWLSLPRITSYNVCYTKLLRNTSSRQPSSGAPDEFRAAFQKVLELGVPFHELGCAEDEKIEFFLTIVRPGSAGERWPLYGRFKADLPGKNFEERTWQV